MVVKGGTSLLAHHGVVPEVPPHSEWGKASYIGKGGDPFWRMVAEFEEDGFVADPLVMFPEAPLSDAPLLSTRFPRLEIERRDYPCCPVDFHAASGPCSDWEAWTDSILEDKSFRDILRRVGVLDSVRLCRSLSCRRDRDGLNGLISRWNSTTSTFVTAWGEFAPTLEDVYVLLGLPMVGVPIDEEGNASEQEVCRQLKKGLTACQEYVDPFKGKKIGKASHWAWLKYYFRAVEPSKEVDKGKEPRIVRGPSANSGIVLAAFLAAWLSRFILPSPPEDGMNSLVFPYAAQLAE